MTAVSVLAIVSTLQPDRAFGSDGVFVQGQLGYSSFVEEGHAPPLCCGERDEWSAPGVRVGARVGVTRSLLLVAADLGYSTHEAPYDLTLSGPDAGLGAGLRLSARRAHVDLVLGVGVRKVSGTASDGGRYPVSETLADVRMGAGMHFRLSANYTLGVDLSIAKVLIEQHVVGVALVFGWDK